MRQEMTHFDEEGNARMVDVSDKDMTKRTAVAEGSIRMSEEAFRAVMEHRIAKGDVLTVAQVAGIAGTKKTSELIPMCHLLALTGAGITFETDPGDCLSKAIDRSMRILDIHLVEKDGGKSGHYIRKRLS